MRHEPGLMDYLRSRPPGEVATVLPVVAEIEFGVQRIVASSRKKSLLEAERDRFLGILKILPWTAESSGQFGSIKAGLERDGELIDDFDIAIAAITMSHDAHVLTTNLTHFSRISGLSSGHWGEGSGAIDA